MKEKKDNNTNYFNNKNMIGRHFGKLTIIKQLETKKIGSGKQRQWLCKCECGGEKISTTGKLTNGTYKDCGCVYRSSTFSHHNWKGYGELSLTLWNSIILGAKRRNIEFDLDIKYTWELFLSQNKKCAYSGIEINFSNNINHNRGNASLDRIDSKLGYIKGNVQWIHKDINRMKNDFTEEIFLSYCNKITENKKQQENTDVS